MSGRVLVTEEDEASITKQTRQRSNNTTALAIMEFFLDLSGFSITKPMTKFSSVGRGMFGQAQMTASGKECPWPGLNRWREGRTEWRSRARTPGPCCKAEESRQL